MGDLDEALFLNTFTQPLLGLPMLMDPHPSQQHLGLQQAVWWPQ